MAKIRSIPLVLFAKTPIAGEVKTRLQPQCTPQQCVDIARILISESVRVVSRVWPGSVSLAVWPDANDSFLQRLPSDHDLSVLVQVAGDLGDKMHAALQQSGYPAAVMGCDVPHIPSAHLSQAYRWLSDGRDVIGPSADGGYYLLGLARPAPTIFNGIKWGTDQVLTATLDRAHNIDRRLLSLPVLNDIDTWADLSTTPLPALQAYLKTMQQE